MGTSTPPPGPGDQGQQPGVPPPPAQPAPPPPQPQPAAGPPAGAPGTPADVGKRVLAAIIDGVLVFVATLIIAAVLSLIGLGVGATGFGFAIGFGWFISTILTIAIAMGYFVYMEGTMNGQTVGKKVMSIRTMLADGGQCTVEAALKRRWWFYVPQIIPIIGGLAAFAAAVAALITFITDQPLHQGFHDKFAGTIVVNA